MIIECEACKSKFELDEGLLRNEGSKVRCSICKHVFLAYPPGLAPLREETEDFLIEELEETAAMETPPMLDEKESEGVKRAMDEDFELAFEEAMETEPIQIVSPDEIPEKEEAVGEKIARREERKEKKKGAKKPKKEAKAARIPGPKKKRVRRVRFFPIFLVIMILVLGGAAATYFYAPDLIPDSLSFLRPVKTQDIGDLGVSRLSFKAVSGSFVQSEKTGQLFVVKGMVTNNYPKSRSFILVKGTILDDKGKVVKAKMAYAGNAFAEKQIKEMSLEQINQTSRNRFGKGRMNVNIRPQGTIPFMIIFDNLPDNLSEFTVEAVSSSPGE
ncbi:MAG: DUF3426 domain-containing protein [Desulfobacteraceae bacterium]|jgi:predicted Zn finger-like uncharacterized protein